MTTRLFLGLTVYLLAASAESRGATFNWDGSTDGSWANGLNWAEGTPTSAIDTALVFGVADQLATSNDIAGGLTLNSLLFGPNAGARTLTGAALTFSGTAPTLISQSTDPGDVRISMPINLAQTLTITGGPSFAAQLLFTNTSGFAGTGGITWAGGVGFTAAASTFSGPVQILGGALGTNSSMALGASPNVTVAPGGSFQVQSSASMNKPLSISGQGFGNSGALNSGTGGGTWAGAVTLAGDARFSAIQSGSLFVNGSVSLGANALTVDTTDGNTVQIFGAITGTGGVTKIGPGTLSLSSASNSVPTNTYTGSTLISAGLVRVARSNAFGTSSLITVQSGAEIELNSRTNASGSPTGPSTVAQPLNLAGRLSAGAPISALDGFVQSWSGPITLTGNAELRAVGGPLGGTTESSLQTAGTIALNGFTLKLAPNATAGRAIVRTVGAINGTGALDIVTGSGTVGLEGSASTFTGPVSVSGNLSIGAGDVFGNPANTVTFQGGSIVSFSNNAAVVVRPWNITGTGGLTIVPSNLAHVIGAAISGPGPVLVTQIGIGSGGIIDLTNTNTFTGGLLVVASSTVRAGANTALGAIAEPVTLSGGSLSFLNDFTVPGSRNVIIGSAGGTFSAPAGVTGTVSANLTGTGAVTIAGGVGGSLGGTVVLNGTNSHPGGVVVTTATLALDSDARIGAPGSPLTLGTISGSFVRPGRLLALNTLQIAATRSTPFASAVVDTNGFSVTFNQPITGTGLTKDGLGILRLNTANPNSSTSNPVAINGGSIVLGVNDALGTGARVSVAAGAALELNGFNHNLLAVEGAGDVKLGAGTLTMRAFFGSVVDGVISGTGGVILDTGSFRFGGVNTFSGGLTVRNGAQLSVLNTNGFGQSGNAVVLDNGGISTTTLGTAPVVLDATVPLTIGAGGARFSSAGFSLVIASALNGSVPIRISGGSDTDEVRFTNPANAFTSNLQIGEGGSDAVLGITGNGTLGSAGNVITLGDRFFDGETVQTARGTLRAFDNLTLPESRAVQINGDGSQGGGAIDTNGFTVRVEGVVSQLRAGIRFEKLGEGTLYLNGSNTYTGRTTVREGELGGTGSIATLRVENGASLSPGDGAGVLTVGALTFTSGSIFALDFSSPSVGDQLVVNDSISLEGDVQLSLRLGYSVGGLSTFTVLTNNSGTPFPSGGGLFAIGDNSLEQGEAFSAAGASWTISYAGGDDNDVVVTVVPEPSTLALLPIGLVLAVRRKRRQP